MSPLFKRKAEFKVVQAEQQPTEQAAVKPPMPMPLFAPTEPKSEEESSDASKLN